VAPVSAATSLRGQDAGLEIYDEPLLLVVDVWSPSTGEYDVDSKIPESKARGDREIWRLHPYERTLTTWIRQADGGYAEMTHTAGVVRPAWLPDVAIDLAALFAVID
jgi:Uma2 family endonuclease